nr:S-methyl-5-thioribose-1-phosphate isomerase [uncultured Cohaesibacter sp.]
MERQDKDLGFLLRFENVAWYENGSVRILDRRVYPRKIEFVECVRHEDVAQAIADMVTQSAGPYTAASMGMALACHEVRDKPQAEQLNHLKKAAYTLSHARPTTVNRMTLITQGCLAVARTALEGGRAADQAILDHTIDSMNRRYAKISQVAEYLVSLWPQNATVMTQCYGETIVGTMLREARNKAKTVKLFCPETRPFLQGARLTASVANDQGFDVTVITDNMPATVMATKGIDVFTSAADSICRDGHIVNKVGTLQIAIVAHHFGVPYYVTGIPDKELPTINDVRIEERDPIEALSFNGVKNTAEGVKGFYPAFDVTPSGLVSAVITDRGPFAPQDLNRYFSLSDTAYW